ncbi:hypothetical protein OYT13_11410 [Pandoraea sp. XJJ-1]|uniref:hypothetical protein n=1 Tax=Pandoraea sp. XJJ-1 TaxID=3002643 RepID=UPI00227E87AA|nr:hypothetical protein [Pandoraea sp. XJJ-1]WAL84955.1 hypothetical protein OYT13_11410 [Pandoraea sp. XJJ-1]
MAKAMGGGGGGGDLLMLAAVGLVALLMTKRATAAPTTGTATRPAAVQSSNPAAAMWNGTTSVLRSILGTGSPDVTATGNYGNGSTGGFSFNTIQAVDNATAAVDGQISADTAAGAGWVAPYNWGQWSVMPNSQFTLPDQLNPSQDLLSGFDNPANYG